ncbi:MAG: hypothetical protein ACRBK7_17925 [Acidimicrobiales bacterium]
MALALALASVLLLASCGNTGEDISEAMTEDEVPADDGLMAGEEASDNQSTDADGADGTLGFGDTESGDTEPGSAGGDDPGNSRIDPPVTTDELPEVSAPDLAEPDDLLPKLKADVGDAVQAAADSPDVAILDAADLSTPAPTAEDLANFGDGHSRTPNGKLIVLDELASLACANVEIALGAVDEGDLEAATANISTAAERAEQSELAGIQSWSEALNEADSGETIDATILVGFLSVCLDGGYVI